MDRNGKALKREKRQAIVQKWEWRSQVISKPLTREGWRLAAAGGLSGMFTNAVLHPLDTLKTVRQTTRTGSPDMMTTLRNLLKTRGPSGLFAGLVPALVGSGLSTMLYFGFYELAKKRAAKTFPKAWHSTRLRVPLTAISAACGNVASSIIYVPKEVVKQRMQCALTSVRVRDVLSELMQSFGIIGFYKGFNATLLRNIPSAMIRFAAYEEFKGVVRMIKRDKDTRRPLSPSELIVAGSMAGALSSSCTTPLDVLKTRMATGIIKPGTALPTAVADIIRQEGIQGLFAGLQPRVLWSALFSAVGFTSYEICKAWLTGKPTRLWNSPSRDIKSTVLLKTDSSKAHVDSDIYRSLTFNPCTKL